MKTYHILTLLVVFLFTGCLKEEKMSIETLIKVNMPEGFELSLIHISEPTRH